MRTNSNNLIAGSVDTNTMTLTYSQDLTFDNCMESNKRRINMALISVPFLSSIWQSGQSGQRNDRCCGHRSSQSPLLSNPNPCFFLQWWWIYFSHGLFIFQPLSWEKKELAECATIAKLELQILTIIFVCLSHTFQTGQVRVISKVALFTLCNIFKKKKKKQYSRHPLSIAHWWSLQSDHKWLHSLGNQSHHSEKQKITLISISGQIAVQSLGIGRGHFLFKFWWVPYLHC